MVGAHLAQLVGNYDIRRDATASLPNVPVRQPRKATRKVTHFHDSRGVSHIIKVFRVEFRVSTIDHTHLDCAYFLPKLVLHLRMPCHLEEYPT